MKSEMVRDLWALGVRPGDALLVHSSLSSLGGIPAGDVVDVIGC